jgi:hypothetical protein
MLRKRRLGVKISPVAMCQQQTDAFRSTQTSRLADARRRLDNSFVRRYLTVRNFLTPRLEVDMSYAATAEVATPLAGSTIVRSKTLYCSFCFKSQHEVRKLIAGPGSIFICDECVELCNGIIAVGPKDKAKSLSIEDLPTERLLERLQPIEDTLQGRGNMLQEVVGILRSRAVSWAQIGAALGISRQTAWERFT